MHHSIFMGRRKTIPSDPVYVSVFDGVDGLPVYRQNKSKQARERDEKRGDIRGNPPLYRVNVYPKGWPTIHRKIEDKSCHS